MYYNYIFRYNYWIIILKKYIKYNNESTQLSNTIFKRYTR